MKIYDTWAISAKRKDTDVKYVETYNLQSMEKLWRAGNSCLLLFIQSTTPMISGDFLTRWNAITVGKGRGIEGKKGQSWAISYFWIEVFLKEVLGLLAYEGTTFMPPFQV